MSHPVLSLSRWDIGHLFITILRIGREQRVPIFIRKVAINKFIVLPYAEGIALL